MATFLHKLNPVFGRDNQTAHLAATVLAASRAGVAAGPAPLFGLLPPNLIVQ
jgi:hypothetical protein